MNSTMMSSSTFLCNVAILAGGQGTRLASRSGDLPKPMVPVMGKPVLQHQIELCRQHGFTDIALLVHHRHEAISDFFGDGSRFGVRIRYEVEETPRGTSGALRDALHALTPQFLLLYGDTYLDIDLRRFFCTHLASGANATLFLHPNDHPYDSDLVDIDDHGLVLGIHPYPHPEGQDLRNLVNAALYAVCNEALTLVTPKTGKADIAKHMFPAMLTAGLCLRGYVTPEYIKDMGTPDRLDKVERDIEVGLPERLSWRNLRKAVFLDRDGTLNREVSHLKLPDQIELLPGVGEAVRQLNRAGILAVLTTNQPVIARGDTTVEGLHRIHARLDSLLGAQRAYLDAIYYCPHHPDKGFDGEVPTLKIICDCRKPAAGMIEQASRDLAISRDGSWMVGDSTADVESGRRAGVRTVLLHTGYAGRDAKHPGRPDYVATSLIDAVQWITEGHERARRHLAPVALAALGRRVVLIGGLARSGKSSAAQVLKELLAVLGKEAHIVSLDGWLKPSDRRVEGSGVLERYELTTAAAQLGVIAEASQRVEFEEPVYDRFARSIAPYGERHSVGRDDVLIVEGVPALCLPELTSPTRTLKLFVSESEEVRLQRLKEDYTARGYPVDTISQVLESRYRDETVTILKSAKLAEYLIDWRRE